jgi:hypothetical protein
MAERADDDTAARDADVETTVVPTPRGEPELAWLLTTATTAGLMAAGLVKRRFPAWPRFMATEWSTRPSPRTAQIGTKSTTKGIE